MENITTEAVDVVNSEKFGIQTTLIMNLGFKTEEHKLIPELLTLDQYNEKVDTFTNYGEVGVMELDCIDEYGSSYTILVNDSILQGSYFKFQRVNVQEA